MAILLFILILFLFLFFFFVEYSFGSIRLDTVVKSIPSPQNTFTVEVIDSNQGALGGDTLVNVHSNQPKVNLWICQFIQSPILVYQGDWGEYETMKISWKNDAALQINGKEYPISAIP